MISISARLENTFTLPILLFLSFILPSMDKFNRVFQKSTENTTCELYSEMNRLVKLYASNLLSNTAILAAGDNLGNLDLDVTNQVEDENLGIGISTWEYLHDLEEELDIKPFFRAVRNFHTSTIKKMLKKFPFEDSLLKDLGILQPNKASSYPVNTELFAFLS